MVYVIIEVGMPLGNFAKIYYVKQKIPDPASGNLKMASRGLGKAVLPGIVWIINLKK